jgi:diguanylate cyclase (GGDEF)-like protein/PAS domain S-box-containing protein
MNDSNEFLKLIVDTITESIVVIDKNGTILFVNQSWVRFGQNNSCVIGDKWGDNNYLEECDKAAKMGDDFGYQAAKGIRQVIEFDQELFYFEYPCHSPDEKRWFIMRVTPFILQNSKYFVISHQNITKRKIAEEKTLSLSRIDGLTNISNRRYFDDFLRNEWKRCARLKLPITLAIIDIDHFKSLNDTYGHQIGDDCLKIMGDLLKKYAKRPSDLCARYGGDEFAIVYGNNKLADSKIHFGYLIQDVRKLKIPNINSPTQSTVTVSIGIATMLPDNKNSETELIKAADKLLYHAKMNGRNQVSF